MRLVSATEEWIRKYLELAELRQLGFRPWPSRLALLVAHGDDLVAGVMVYDSTGPFLFYEHLITSPLLPARQRWEAVTMMAEEMISFCRHFGKVPQIAVNHRSLKKILSRVGLQAASVLMTCGVNQLETHDYERKEDRHPHPDEPDAFGSVARSAPTLPAPPFC